MIANIEGKVVVITGSSRGIGRELAIKFAKEKAKVVINFNHNEEAANKLIDELTTYKDNVRLIRADVTKVEEVFRLYQQTIKEFGQIDILINNAGVSNNQYINFMSEKAWNDVINTNLNGVYICSKIFIKGMIKRKEGKIFNISSLIGQIGREGQTNYAASKAGVIGFTKSLAKELGPYNISVNAICPGLISTELYEETDGENDLLKMEYLPGKNKMGNLVNFVAFMSSDSIDGVTGQVFNIDSRLI